MAHEIDLSNDRVNYAYVKEHGSVWHGLGNVMELGAPLDDWKDSAGLTWEAKTSPIVFNDGNDMPTIFPDRIALFRSDNNAPLSIMGKDYKIVQPSQIVDFFADILDKHNMEMSSVGSLFSGKRFFATAKLGEISPLAGDNINSYLLLSTSLDGTLATNAKCTSIRTVCNNTLTMALGEKSSKNVIRVPHSTEFNASKAKLELGLIEETQYNFQENMKKLANARISDSDALKFYQDMFYNKDVPADEQHTRVVNRVNDIIHLYKFGKGSSFAQNTLYQVLQGVTDYYTNGVKNRSDSAKFWNSYYGSGDSVKSEVANKLLAIAG